MGITNNYYKFILRHTSQKDLGKVLSIGRQQLFIKGSKRDEITYLDELNQFNQVNSQIDILDISDYEGANIVHDLSKPIERNYNNKYNYIIDGGVLEHVFNAPIAIQNYLNLLTPNGLLLISTVANNQCGHGLYQFSPELFFSICRNIKNIEIKECLIEPHKFLGAELSDGPIYKVEDPSSTNSRVLLRNSRPTTMYICIEKTTNDLISFDEVSIVQYDYVVQHNSKKIESKRLKKIINMLPKFLSNILKGQAQHFYFNINNRKLYKRIQL